MFLPYHCRIFLALLWLKLLHSEGINLKIVQVFFHGRNKSSLGEAQNCLVYKLGHLVNNGCSLALVT